MAWGFTYSAYGLLQKTKKEYTFLKKQEVHNINELEKACFQHDMAYRDFKDWTTRTASNTKYYTIKHLILLKIQNMMYTKKILLQ